jgi:hypothetical protein
VPARGWTKRRGSAIHLLSLLALGLGAWGCSDSSGGGGFGAFGGAGGVGGMPTSMLRVAHLAAGVPEVDDTRLDFTVVDEGSFNSISFGRASRAASLASGVVQVDVTEPGGGLSLASVSVELEADVQYTVAAYRNSDEANGTGLMVFDEGTDGLESGLGRVVIGHAAEDSTWASVDVVDVDTDEVLVSDLGLGEQSEPLDFSAGEHRLGFSTSSVPPAIDEGPFRIAVSANQTAVVIAVDRDVADASVDAAVYVLEPNTSGVIPVIPSE